MTGNRGALRLVLAGALLAPAVLAMAACPGATDPASSARITPRYDPATGRLQQITYDRNGDGALDAWSFMDGTRVVRVELDDDFDGKVDRWEYYDAAGAARPGAAAPAGPAVLSRVEQATRGDGGISRWEAYEQGQLTTAEEDTTADGRVDKWERWSNGVLQHIAFDTHGRGAPDRRLVYPADGGEPRLEVDRTHTGRFEPVSPASPQQGRRPAATGAP